jgi:hypothetical protein
MIVDGIKYTKIGKDEYYAQVFMPI